MALHRMKSMSSQKSDQIAEAAMQANRSTLL